MNVVFVHPGMLLLIWLAPAMAGWWLLIARRRERRLDEFISATMRKKLGPSDSRWRSRCQVMLLSAGLMLAVVAAARPQWGLREEQVVQRGRDLMIALDVSRSMLANDVHPSRLERAKADVLDLIDELRGDRAGLIAFRHKAVLLCPLTTDYVFLKQMVDSVDIDSAPAGETDIADALRKAFDSFGDDSSSHKAIVLISDGEDLTGRALAEADELAKKNVPVFTVGLGNRDGARIPEASASGGYLQFKGEPVITRLHDDVLHAIAQKTGGAYVPVGLASMATTTLGTLYRDHLRRIAARDQEEIIERRHVERYQIFLLPGLLLLVAASCFSRGRLTAKSTRAAVFAKPLQSGKLAFLSGIAGGADGAKPAMEAKRPLRDLTPPKRPLKNISAAVTIVLASLVARGQSTNTGVTSNSGVDKQGPESLEKATVETGMRGHDAAWKAARLLAAGRHEEAARLFLDAAKTAPLSAQQKYRYNAAVALYRAGKFTEAAQILRGLLREASTPEVSVCTGLGAALYREAERKAGEDATNLVERARLLREAGEAFKLAARTERGDTSAQHNMAVVLRKLPEAEEQARIAQLMANYGKVPAANLLNLMLLNQRRINEESRAAFTNNSPSQILHLEALARQQKENAELWIPLKNKLLAAVSAQPDLATNHQYAARLEKVVESLRDHMLENAESLRDLDPSGHPAAKQAEWGIYQIWKGVAPFPLVLEEAIRRQTNCIVQTSDLIAGKTADLSNIRTEQQETSELTTLFGERFRLAVPEGGIPATTNNQEQSAGCGTPGSTTVGTDSGGGPNGSETAGGQGSKPVVGGLSAEMRQQILALAEQAIAAQQSAIKHLDASQPSESLVQQRVSHNLLCEIRKLLPKEQTASEPGAEEKKQPGEEAQPPESRSPGPDQNSEVPTTPAEQPTSQDAKEKEKEKEKEKRELTDGEIQNLLQQALEREKTYDTERKLRNRRIPMLPRERDW